jgi:hypothetical protein
VGGFLAWGSADELGGSSLADSSSYQSVPYQSARPTNEDVMILLERIYGPEHPELEDCQCMPGVLQELMRRGLIGTSAKPLRNVYGPVDRQEHILSVLGVLEQRTQAGVGAGLPWTATVTLIRAASNRALDPRYR